MDIKALVSTFVDSVEIKEIDNFSDDKLRKAYNIDIRTENAKHLIDSIIIEQLKQSIPQGFRQNDSSFYSEEKIKTHAKQFIDKNQSKTRAEAILEECLEDIFNSRIATLTDKHHSAPKIEKKSEDNNRIQYQVEFDCFDINSDLSSISLNSYEYKVTDEDIQKEIDELLKSETNLQESTDPNRTVLKNDLISVEFVGRIKAAGKEKLIEFTRSRPGGELTQLGEGNMLPDFENGVIGMRIDETKKNVQVNFPKDYHSSNVAGLNAVFEITVKKIFDKCSYKNAEEFAEKNKIGNVEKLKELVALSIKKKIDEIISEIKRREFFEKIKDVDITSPELIIEQEFNNAKMNYLSKKIQEKPDESLSDEEKELGIKKDLENLLESIKTQVKLSMILADYEKKHNISLEQQDLMIALAEYSQRTGTPQETVIEQFRKNKNALDNFRRGVLEGKILNFIINQLNSNTIQSSVDEIKKIYENTYNKSGK